MGMIPEDDLFAITVLHDAYGLSAKEAQVLILLARGRIVENEQITSVYCDTPHANPIEARSAIKRIRRKVSSKIQITSHYGVGYELADASRKQVRAILQQGRA